MNSSWMMEECVASKAIKTSKQEHINFEKSTWFAIIDLMGKILSLLLLFTLSLFAELPSIWPPPLQTGDLIAILFPASFPDLSDEEAKELLVKQAEWLHSQGYRTIFYPDKVERIGYLAGTDQERAEAFMDAWKNEEVKALWCFRGGYGTPRILDQLDYEIMKAHPKILIGMSDITALHQAIQQKTGLVTFLAPVLKYFNEEAAQFDQEYALASFKNLIVDQTSGEMAWPSDFASQVITPGIARGKLVGGNLSLITALCGTKWQLDTQGKILILEDTSTSIYQIDRMLWQLEQAGVLDQPAAVILASWADCRAGSRYSLTLEEVFDHYFKDANYPVIHGFPSGHIRHQLSLPLHAMMEIDTDTKIVKVFKAPRSL